jgi:hypothetical protein
MVVNLVQKINKKSSTQLCRSKTSQIFFINICPLGRKKDKRKKETNKRRKEKEYKKYAVAVFLATVT